ncbi:TrmH family RNA methyltransferase [Tengunoibacter tsumagoiensis]|uniref:rRNA methyltransferase n=1 Tax=Tengunoibacter tsumagoiensis TaxID=2014871 RepID=A0A401ZTZ8_9CHLR|nr:RNA methyltransferase [Tengunoibacter tsumagoiensis]GCE10333.1 rRNA methyltransferase [Tengunoibacter tsumagoiensis]
MTHDTRYTLITSPANARVSKLQTLHTSRGRKKSGLFLLEGLNLLEAVLETQVPLQEVYVQPDLLRRTPKGTALLERLLHRTDLPPERLFEVNERVIDALGEVQSSQGVICVLRLDALNSAQMQDRRQPAHRPVLLILDDIADPGNMGTILRTALAADVSQVILTPNCVDYYSPKVVRAATGAHLRLPVVVDASWAAIATLVKQHCQGQPRVLLAEAGSSQMYYEQDFTQPCVLIMGNEAHGPSVEAHTLATHPVSIPLANDVESLNVAMATGIILYETVRQRQRR